MRKLFILALIATFFLVSEGHCYWIWSPKTGKWINPKYETKPNPQEQLTFAKSIYDAKDYESALKEFKKLIRKYPKAFEASEAQFYIGLCLENTNKFYEAYLAYQKVLDKYPFTQRTDEIIQKEFNIAERFLSGEKLKAMGIPLPVDNPAIEIYQKIIANSQYGKLAPAAQYKLGLVLKSLSRYQEAQEEFQKVVNNYPESEWVEPAKYQIALCLVSMSPKAGYDRKPAEEAKEKFEQFVKGHPQAQITNEAENQIDQIKEKEAETNFKIAQFYEKQKQFASAQLYYQDIIGNYPKSIWAAKAMERLQVMEKKK
jgi:outer membrane protein assembly factor BamD